MLSAFVLSRLSLIEDPHALDRACLYFELRARDVRAKPAFETAAAAVNADRQDTCDPETLDAHAAALNTKPAPRLCDYCESAPATGYVAAYKAHVCRPCYADNHGGPADMLDAGEEA